MYAPPRCTGSSRGVPAVAGRARGAPGAPGTKTPDGALQARWMYRSDTSDRRTGTDGWGHRARVRHPRTAASVLDARVRPPQGALARPPWPAQYRLRLVIPP